MSDDPDLLDVTLSELMEYEMTGEDKDYILIKLSSLLYTNFPFLTLLIIRYTAVLLFHYTIRAWITPGPYNC